VNAATTMLMNAFQMTKVSIVFTDVLELSGDECAFNMMCLYSWHSLVSSKYLSKAISRLVPDNVITLSPYRTITPHVARSNNSRIVSPQE
jgi:hypothetical protein